MSEKEIREIENDGDNLRKTDNFDAHLFLYILFIFLKMLNVNNIKWLI